MNGLSNLSGPEQNEKSLREHLRRQNELLDKLNEAQHLAMVGSWDWDLQTQHVWWSDETYRIFGVDPQNYTPSFDGNARLIHPEDLPVYRAAFQRCFETGQPLEMDIRLLISDSQVKNCVARGRIIRDASGKPTRVVGTILDITERVRAERRIRQLNRVYSLLSDINQVIVRIKDEPSLLDAACRIAVEKGGFQMAWIGMLDKDSNTVRLKASAGRVEGYFDAAGLDMNILESNAEPVMKALFDGVQTVCSNLEREAGSAPWGAAALSRGYRAAAAFPLSAGGQTVGAFGLYSAEAGVFDPDELKLLGEMASDLSFALEAKLRDEERQRAEAARQEIEARFQELAETVEDVFWISDPETRCVLYISPSYETIWGQSCQHILNKTGAWLESLHEEDRKRFSSAGISWPPISREELEYRIVRPDKQVRWIRDRAFPVRNAEDKVIRVVGIARDITDRRQLEQQLRQSQKLEAIGHLAGGVAHDFNNILAAIMLHLSDLQQNTNATPDIQSAVNELMEEAQRAASLTRQLLIFSRRSALEIKNVDLNEVVGNLLKMLGRLIGEHISLSFVRKAGLPAVEADPSMMEQVLVNLCVNARDSMPKGGQLAIQLEPVLVEPERAQSHADIKPGEFVCLSVQDTGCGMDEAILHRIFEPFFTTKELGKGTGLGLATVHGIVSQHSGWIEVESQPQQGSIFRVFLPSSPMKASSAGTLGKPLLKRGSETVLLVEDEASLRRITKLNLQRLGYCVFEASGGWEALSVWHNHQGKIDLLVSDMVMPGGMSGLDVVERLRELKPKLKAIIVSGYNPEQVGRSMHSTLDVAFLTKPYGVEVLANTVRQCLDSAP